MGCRSTGYPNQLSVVLAWVGVAKWNRLSSAFTIGSLHWRIGVDTKRQHERQGAWALVVWLSCGSTLCVGLRE
jgi:hypothetical protein